MGGVIVRVLPVTALLLILAACGGTRPPATTPAARPPAAAPHATLQATLWVQTAAEYRALTEQIYENAARSLALALADSAWTALDQPAEARRLPPAVIVDIDETVLDNSAFLARVIRRGGEFDPDLWDAWIAEAAALAVPGALEFAREAARRGVAIYYITNRDSLHEDATARNLAALGFPLDAAPDAVLTRGEREGWGSVKTSRRQAIAGHHRVVLLMGDDLNDFVDAQVSREARRAIVDDNGARWGVEWFVLPNPVYGSWEGALLDYETGLSDEERARRKQAGLRTE